MRFEITLNRFRLISGLSDSDAEKWLPVIRDSIDYVSSLVTKKDPTERDLERVQSAAGVYAYYRYIAYSVDTESRTSVGSFSMLSNSKKLLEAEKMWESELESLGDIISDGSFFFRRI